MFKRILVALAMVALAIILSHEFAYAQPYTLWAETYGGTSNDEARSVEQTSDGGYIITGSIVSFGAGASDFWLIKTHAQGDTLWTKTYGGGSNELAWDGRQTSGGIGFSQPPKDASPKVKEKMVAAEKMLKKVEDIIAKIEKKGLVEESDASDLDSAIIGHVQAMTHALKTALSEAEVSVKQKAEQVDLKSLDAFETEAAKHEARMKKIGHKCVAITAKLQIGDIQPGKGLLKKMTPGQKKDFEEFLSPEGRKKLKEKNPDFFKSELKDDSDLRKSSLLERAGELLAKSSKMVSDLLVTPAEAAVGAGTGWTCYTCPGCCLVAIPRAYLTLERIAQELDSCLRSKAWWDWWGKTGCWLLWGAIAA